ncbi:MAG: ParA family protein [Oligoflexales bacterium]|nr:ParA family protein [Oligoflexales bacterium]
MKIISFLNSKGGVGKTTLCVNIADFLFCEGYKVLVIDADPQGSVRDWQESRGAETKIQFDIIGADRKQTLLNLPYKKQKNQIYDFILIDTPGNLSDIVSAAISMSDLCLIPIQPSPYDVWSSQAMIELVKIRQGIDPNLKSAIIINRAIPNTIICKEVIAELQKCEIPVLQQYVNQRVAYAHSAGIGQTVINEKNLEAFKEIVNLGKQIIEVSYGIESKEQS